MMGIFSGRSRLTLAVLAMAVALAGCVEPEPPVPVKPLSPAVKRDVMNMGLAFETVARCGGRLDINAEQMERVLPRLEKEMTDQGGPQPSKRTIHAIMDKTLSEKELQDQLLGFVQSRNILLSDSRSWCAAGAKEIAAGTALGKFLKLKT